MYGAILGDIAGSRYEFSKPAGFNPNTVELFSSLSRFTDDTVLTVATKYAILNKLPYHVAYRNFCRRYPNAGYGNMFRNWVQRRSSRGYYSYGNGAAMRVSFVGMYYNTLEAVESEAERSAICTHNHKDGLKAAKATAGAVYLARRGSSKKEIAKYFKQRYGYTVSKPLWTYRPFSKFDATAEGSMPVAIRCFLESDDWESCVRNVYRINCDTDTVACIAGGIADAFYQGTGFDEDKLLQQYLIKPNAHGQFDQYLYECATQKVENEVELV